MRKNVWLNRPFGITAETTNFFGVPIALCELHFLDCISIYEPSAYQAVRGRIVEWPRVVQLRCCHAVDVPTGRPGFPG